MLQRARYFFLYFIFASFVGTAQIYNEAEITVDFNNHNFNEKHEKIQPQAKGIMLAEDRFGNKESAIYIQGYLYSYFNLGTSPLLKPQKATISVWVNLDRDVRTGHGAAYNPIIVTKNSTNHGWYNAYSIGLDLHKNYFTSVSSVDSTKAEAIGTSLQPVQFGKWYHLVMVFDNEHLAFYVNGELQNSCVKNFKTFYLSTDSVIVGHSASKVNERFSTGIFDDIQIFHRVLNQQEIHELYKAPNPNKLRRIVSEVLKYLGIVLICIVVIVVILIRNKRILKRQKEKLELHKHIAELEMKVVKTQMNPHFISNCLAAIQELIYSGNIDKAGQYIAKFSLFLRQVLDYSDKTYITLEEEIEIIKLNIELEQLRFKEKFDFILNVKDKINPKEILIPSLITQPLVENAIWHGLLPLKEIRKPRLSLNIYQKEGSVYLEIEDNGVGRKRAENNHGRASRGTKLVKDKLDSISKLTQSTNYKLQIIDLIHDKNEPGGTKIIIQLDNNSEID